MRWMRVDDVRSHAAGLSRRRSIALHATANCALPKLTVAEFPCRSQYAGTGNPYSEDTDLESHSRSAVHTKGWERESLSLGSLVIAKRNLIKIPVLRSHA